MNLKTFAKLVTQTFADKSDFLGLLLPFVLQLKRDLLSFIINYIIFRIKV